MYAVWHMRARQRSTHVHDCNASVFCTLLHDSSVLHIDFLGATYNETVNELLSAPENTRDDVLRAVRARSWARQPDPDERAAQESSGVGAGEAYPRAHAHVHAHDRTHQHA